MNTHGPQTELDLPPYAQETLAFSRTIGLISLLIFFAGGVAMITNMSQFTLSNAFTFYIIMIAVGFTGLFIAHKQARILMKHHLIHLNLFLQISPQKS